MKIFRAKSKFNDIIVLETQTWGKALFLNNELQSTERDQEIYHRALCFNAMQPAARHVLVLGAGEGSTARMILNSGPDKQVAMVEIDQKVIDVCREHIPSMSGTVWDNPRLHLIIDDAFTFVNQCSERFDAVVSDLSSPSPDGISEPLYTKHFYSKVKDILKPGGIFVTQATHRPDRYWKEFKEAFPQSGTWSEWVPSFGVPWHFFGGIYESKLKLA
jgi:spermidine synthase